MNALFIDVPGIVKSTEQNLSPLCLFCLICFSGDDVIGSLMYAIETAVVDWSAQINDILKQQSGQAIANGEFPLPIYEYEFWEQRMNCMHDIYEQLIHPKVKKMAVILEVNKSAYANPFKEMFKRVVRGK